MASSVFGIFVGYHRILYRWLKSWLLDSALKHWIAWHRNDLAIGWHWRSLCLNRNMLIEACLLFLLTKWLFEGAWIFYWGSALGAISEIALGLVGWLSGIWELSTADIANRTALRRFRTRQVGLNLSAYGQIDLRCFDAVKEISRLTQLTFFFDAFLRLKGAKVRPSVPQSKGFSVFTNSRPLGSSPLERRS